MSNNRAQRRVAVRVHAESRQQVRSYGGGGVSVGRVSRFDVGGRGSRRSELDPGEARNLSLRHSGKGAVGGMRGPCHVRLDRFRPTTLRACAEYAVTTDGVTAVVRG